MDGTFEDDRPECRYALKLMRRMAGKLGLDERYVAVPACALADDLTA